jgi:succinate-semialdehyde dehydrogenase / glutarate-semialdehyde dehydrogenase
MKTYSLYLNGRWESGDAVIPVIDPATGEPFAQAATIGRARVRQALEDAQAAWPAWRALTGMQRGDYLLAIAAEVGRRADEIAAVMTRESGKPLAQSRGEVNGTIDHLRWFAEEARRAYGRIVPHQAPGKRHMVLKVPVGVVGAISPWNFPLILSIRKAAPALAAGCPVVLKPASATPLCNLLFAECVEAAGLPPGVFQVVLGRASEIAAEMLANPICRKISFTGSTPVGKKLIEGAAQTCTLLSLELGGNAPVIVFADADMEQAVEGTLLAKFRNTGQSCIAANRIYVERPIYAQFLAAFSAKLQTQRVGPGLEPGVDIGAMIDEAALQEALQMIDGDGGPGGAAGVRRPALRRAGRVPGADHPGRRARRRRLHAPGDFRPDCGRDPLRRRGGGDRPGQRYRIWPGGLRLHHQPGARLAAGGGAGGGDDRHQRRRAFHQQLPLWRLQGERLGAGAGQRRAGGVPGNQAHLLWRDGLIGWGRR